MHLSFEEILQNLAAVNYDDGYRFLNRDRLDRIEALLAATEYKKVNDSGLFELYTYRGEIPPNAVLVSTHVDCVREITECFARDLGNGLLQGTFDNLITNAVIVSLMMENALGKNVLVAFTGDEEDDAYGARDVAAFLKSRNCRFSAVVLDVTHMGWEREACFSVENDFRFEGDFGKEIIRICKERGEPWTFVPSDVEQIPEFVPREAVIPVEALCDESWEYDEAGISCCSFCIPTMGEMHGNSGLTVRKNAVTVYKTVLRDIANSLSSD